MKYPIHGWYHETKFPPTVCLLLHKFRIDRKTQKGVVIGKASKGKLSSSVSPFHHDNLYRNEHCKMIRKFHWNIEISFKISPTGILYEYKYHSLKFIVSLKGCRKDQKVCGRRKNNKTKGKVYIIRSFFLP